MCGSLNFGLRIDSVLKPKSRLLSAQMDVKAEVKRRCKAISHLIPTMRKSCCHWRSSIRNSTGMMQRLRRKIVNWEAEE